MPRRKRRKSGIYIPPRILFALALVIGLAMLANVVSYLSFWTVVLTVCIAGYIVWRWWDGRRRTRFRHLVELLALTPAQFEHAVGNLLFDMGYRRIHRVGRSGDLAADLFAVDSAGRTVAVQCKRYAPGSKIGSPEIQKFIGMMAVHHQTQRGLFVTTSDFSEPARSLAARHGIELFDGARLGDTLAQLSASQNRTPLFGQ